MAMLNNQRVIIILIFHCAIKKKRSTVPYIFSQLDLASPRDVPRVPSPFLRGRDTRTAG